MLNKKQNCKIIAHRGLSSEAPENTVAAFNLAAKEGYDGIECDVHATKDNQLVTFHDYTLKRMTGKKGSIRNLTYNELKDFQITGGNHQQQYHNLKIPKLEEYLKICKEHQLIGFIELKHVNDKQNLNQLIDLINEYQLLERIYVMSFNYDYLLYLRKQSSKIKIQYLVKVISNHVIKMCKSHRFDVGVDVEELNKQQIIKCHKENIKVNVWTVDDLLLAKQLIINGIDFLTTNRLRKNMLT